MQRILYSLCAAVLLSLCLPSDASAEGRWKISGNDCVWDQCDSGANQCGRFKIGGEFGCYWEINDSGGDQCTPDADLPTAIAVADDLTSVTAQDEDLQAAIDVLATHGVVVGDDYTDLVSLDQNPHAITCQERNILVAKAEGLSAKLNFATYFLGGGAIAAVGLFPPAVPGLGVGALLTGALSGLAGSPGTRLSNMSCS
jgi:hypothetical protein